MEAELFVNPDDKTWDSFEDVKDERLRLVPSDGGEIELSLAEAVERGVIAHQTIAYFMWFTKEFLIAVGVDEDRLRFRQHLRTEMAHYACDCWDAETLLSYGWTELVGIADRGSWDLSRHIQFSKAELTAFRRFEDAREAEISVIKPKYGLLGPKFKGLSARIGKALEEKDPAEVDGAVILSIDGETVEVGPEYFEIVTAKEKLSGEKVVPHVIEPSHGLDRILYTVLEHAYSRPQEDRVVLRLRPEIAPVKVGVFPLMTKDGLEERAREIDEDLRLSGFPTYYDDSGSIGRRYARMDEIGTPWCITVDYETMEDDTVTIRDRDTSEQVRIDAQEAPIVVNNLLCGVRFNELLEIREEED